MWKAQEPFRPTFPNDAKFKSELFYGGIAEVEPSAILFRGGYTSRY